MNRFAIVIEVAGRLIAVTSNHKVSFCRLDEDHGEVGREGGLVLAHWPPFVNDGLVLLRFRAIIILHDLTLFLLSELLQANRVNVHATYLAATILKPKGYIRNVDEQVVLVCVASE